MMSSRPFSASELNKLDEDMSWYDDPEMPSWVTDEQHRKSSMTEDEIRDLEDRVQQAREIALISIGQPDRAGHVKRREELEAQLREARATDD